jgi:hypothetical protein
VLQPFLFWEPHAPGTAGLSLQSSKHMQVVNDGTASQVKEILAGSVLASTTSGPSPNMS